MVFNKLIWCTIGPKSFLFALRSSLFGQMMQLIMIILSLTALTLCQLAQDVFSMVHTLTIVEPIWPMLQKISKTLKGNLYDCFPSKYIHFSVVIYVAKDVTSFRKAQSVNGCRTCIKCSSNFN